MTFPGSSELLSLHEDRSVEREETWERTGGGVDEQRVKVTPPLPPPSLPPPLFPAVILISMTENTPVVQ